MDKIYIHRGDCVVFADITDFLTFMIDSQLDLTNWKAEFHLCSIIKKYDDISSKVIKIILSSEETSLLKCGTWNGALVLIDANGHRKTITNTIPFEVTKEVVENHYQTIDLTIPQSSGVDVTLKVGVDYVTSVNGMTGDVYLDIPSIKGLATEQQLAQGLNTKQDKGDYALREEIPSLEGYVKDTDYASDTKAGVVKAYPNGGFSVSSSSGVAFCGVKTLSNYQNSSDTTFIGKGTLENIKDDYIKRALTQNTMELTEEDKASTKQLLGYATPTDIMQAIASIPQFKMSIVEELPLAGEKMTLYLVPKEGTNNDVYDEYIWIEQTESFEHLGTTAVDLTEYVKNTDYASSSKAGVVKTSVSTGVSITSGLLYVVKATDDEIKAKTNLYKPIVPSNLDYAVKTGVATNTIELTDDEKSSARTWLGAVGNTDYAQGSVGGVVKVSSSFAITTANGYIQPMTIPIGTRYDNLSQYAFIGKGTLENVLTQYSKTVLTTEADYNALTTKDANTLYLIEE